MIRAADDHVSLSLPACKRAPTGGQAQAGGHPCSWRCRCRGVWSLAWAGGRCDRRTVGHPSTAAATATASASAGTRARSWPHRHFLGGLYEWAADARDGGWWAVGHIPAAGGIIPGAAAEEAALEQAPVHPCSKLRVVGGSLQQRVLARPVPDAYRRVADARAMRWTGGQCNSTVPNQINQCLAWRLTRTQSQSRWRHTARTWHAALPTGAPRAMPRA